MTLSRTVRGLAATVAAGLTLTACGNADISGEEPQTTATGEAGTVITYNSPAEWGNWGGPLNLPRRPASPPPTTPRTRSGSPRRRPRPPRGR